jgi:hypothetical protein
LKQLPERLDELKNSVPFSLVRLEVRPIAEKELKTFLEVEKTEP